MAAEPMMSLSQYRKHFLTASAGIVAGLQEALAVGAILSLAALVLGLFIGRSRAQ